MATPKNDKAKSKAAPKSNPKLKELSRAEQKKTKGGLSSGVFGGLAGPETYLQP